GGLGDAGVGRALDAFVAVVVLLANLAGEWVELAGKLNHGIVRLGDGLGAAVVEGLPYGDVLEFRARDEFLGASARIFAAAGGAKLVPGGGVLHLALLIRLDVVL